MDLQIVWTPNRGPRPRVRAWRWAGIAAFVTSVVGSSHAALGQAFFFTPPLNLGDILSAKFVGDFAGLTAHRYIGTTEVNRITLADSDRMLPSANLSDAFFGTSTFNAAAQINQTSTQTGLFSAAIPAAFYPVLLKGKVDLIGVITDTVDSAFAIDSLYLEINTTSRGVFRAFYGSGLDGFLLTPPIPIGGNLPSPVQTCLPSGRTGTGFDETISSKAFDVPGPGAGVLVCCALAIGARRRR